MNENELINVEELTDEQLEAMSGAYIVDLSAHRGHSWFALVDDKTGRVYGFREDWHVFKEYDEGQENSLEVISMDRYAEIFGKSFYR